MGKPRSKIGAIRQALADYMYSEGCSCCRDQEAHDEAATKLGKLLRVRKYDDGSGYDFYSHRTAPTGDAGNG